MFNTNSPIVQNMIQECKIPPEIAQGNMYFGNAPTLNGQPIIGQPVMQQYYQPQFINNYQPQNQYQGSLFDSKTVVENNPNYYQPKMPLNMNLFNNDDGEFHLENELPEGYTGHQNRQLFSPLDTSPGAPAGYYNQGYMPSYGYNNWNPYNPNVNPNYNSAFYSGGFSNYFNPYLYKAAQDRQEREQKALMEKERAFRLQEAEIFKKISRACNTFRGNDIEDMEEHLKQYDPPEIPDPNKKSKTLKVCIIRYDDDGNVVSVYRPGKEYDMTKPTDREEEAISLHLMQAAPYMIEGNIFEYRKVLIRNAMYDEAKRRIPDNVGIIEFLNSYANPLMLDIRQEQNLKYAKEQMLTRSTNFKDVINFKRDYKPLFQQFIGNPSETGITVTDKGGLEITPPQNIMSNYEQRKAEFLRAIKPIK